LFGQVRGYRWHERFLHQLFSGARLFSREWFTLSAIRPVLEDLMSGRKLLPDRKGQGLSSPPPPPPLPAPSPSQSPQPLVIQRVKSKRVSLMRVRISTSEKLLFIEAAKRSGRTLSNWCRWHMDQEIRRMKHPA
jgi:hypothetical protein